MSIAAALIELLTSSKLREAQRRADELQGRNFELTREVDDLRQRLNEVTAEERLVYRTMLNVEYQTRYGWTPFPTEPHIPQHIEEKSVVEQAAQGGFHEARLFAEKQAREDWMKLYDGT